MNPLPAAVVILAGMAFTTLLYGSELASESFPALEDANPGACGGGGLDRIACVIGALFEGLVNVFRLIFGVAVFFWNLVSFNVPGAPWFVRLLVGGFFGGTILWAIAAFIRG